MSSQNVIRIMCPNMACKRVLAVPCHARGKLVRCRGCGINIRIPVQKTEKTEQAAQQPPSATEEAA